MGYFPLLTGAYDLRSDGRLYPGTGVWDVGQADEQQEEVGWQADGRLGGNLRISKLKP